MSYQNSCIFTLLDVHFRLPSPLASVTFLQLCIVTMCINHMKCWIRQAKPASKALLEHCEGTAEQGTPNSNSEKRGSACWVLLDSLLEMTLLEQDQVISRGPFQPQEFCRSVIFLWKKNSLCYSALFLTALPTSPIVLPLNHLFFPPYTLIFPFIFVFASLLFSVSPIFSSCSMCATIVTL